MQYGIEVVTLGDYADPRPVVRLAQAAEAAGWDSLFLWDHLAFVWNVPSGDPWVILAAVAQATRRLKLGTAVTPLPRRRPYVLANTLATLDLLSDGRMIFGAGLGGVAQEFAAFGEPDDARQRAAMLDEGLELLDRLWSGQAVRYRGTHYRVDNVTLAPVPVQRPRIPIWIGGESPAALRRAARWDGWIIGGVNQDGTMAKTPDDVSDKLARIGQQRSSTAPFDVAMTGYSQPGDRALPRSFADAGVTWWLESLHGSRGTEEQLLRRVKAGPPA